MPTSLLRAGPLAADFVSGTNRPTFAVRNGHRVAVFPAGVVTETFYTFNMPTVYASGDVTILLTWMAGVATSGSVVWEVAFEKHAPGVDDLDVDSFAAGVFAVDATDAVTGVTTETAIILTSAQIDGVVQGDQFRLAVRRHGNDTSDDMVGVAQLMTVVIEQDAAPGGGGGGGFWTDGVGTRAGIGKGSPAPEAAGLESLAHGSNASAAGANSWAFGDAANAGFADTLAHGRNAIARATDGIAIGRGADAGAANDIAIGRGAFTHTVLSTNGIAIGYGARSESPDHICIGRGFVSSAIHTSNDLITIGRGNSNSLVSVGGILIGKESQAAGKYNTSIGNKNRMGGRYNIVIGNYFMHAAHGQDPTDLGFYNVVIKAQRDGRAGLDNQGGGNHYGNLVMVSGGSRAGIRGYSGLSANYNTFLGQGDSYIYGTSHENILIGGKGNVLGDIGNATQYQRHNVIVGHYNSVASFSTGDSLRNTAVGFENRIQGNTYNYGQTAIGNENYCYSGVNFVYGGTVAIGTGNRVSNRANVGLGFNNYLYKVTTQAYNTFRGNFAVGDFCKSYPLSNVPWRSTMAQGIRARAWVGGHRAFSADDNIASTKPNQSGWVTTHIETTDATQTTVLTFPTEADKAYSVWGFAVARRTDVDGFNAVFGLTNTLVYRNAAGAPVLVGAPKAWTLDSSQGAPAWTMDITSVGNDIVARVTGTAAQTVEWLSEIHILEVRG